MTRSPVVRKGHQDPESGEGPPSGSPAFYTEASTYDILHAPGTAAEVDSIERIAERFAGPTAVDPASLWLEPACGTARHLRLLAARGRRALGFDTEPAMLEYARARLRSRGCAHRVRLFEARMEDFANATPAANAGNVRVAFNLINTIRHLLSDDAIAAHLACVHRTLAPGGLYLVGLGTHRPELDEPTEDVWTGARGTVRVTQTVQYLPPPEFGERIERVISHVVRTSPASETHSDSTYDLRTYTLAQWQQVIDDSPLDLAGVVDEDSTDIEPPDPGYAIFVLVKR